MPEPYHQRIDQLFCEGDFRGALACAEEAIARNPSDPGLHLKRADCRMTCDETADIRDDVQQALNLDPNSSDAYAYLAAYWLVRFDLKQCRIECEKTLKLDSENYAALYFRGSCRSWDSEHELAESDYRQVLKLTENSQVPKRELLNYYYYRAATFVGLDDSEESLQANTEAIRVFPNHPDFYIQRALEYLYDSASQKDLTAAESDLRTAESLSKKIEKRYSFLYYAWGVFYSSHRKIDKALEMIDTALEIQPQMPLYHICRGKLLVNHYQNPEGALENFNTFIRLAPKHYLGYLERYSLLQGTAQLKAAQADMKQVLRLLPPEEDALLEITQKLNAHQGFLQAREICNKIIEKNPKSADAYFDRGYTWHLQGIYDMAYQDFDEAIRKSETEDPLWFSYRGNAANALAAKLFVGKRYYFRKALKDYSKACELEPKTPEYLAGRGYSWYNIARRNWFDKSGYRKAIDDLTEAIRLASDDPDYYLHRAEVYWQLGEFDQVIENCTQAIHLDAENLAAYSLRRNAYLKKQNVHEAGEDVRKIHELEDALFQQYEAQKTFCEKHENKNRVYPF